MNSIFRGSPLSWFLLALVLVCTAVGTWAAYLAIRLTRVGYLVTVNVVSVALKDTGSGEGKIALVTGTMYDAQGRGGEYRFETEDPPEVGATKNIYLWTSGSDRGEISTDWRFRWMLSVFAYSAAVTIVFVYGICMRFGVGRSLTITMILIVVTASVLVSRKSLERTLTIRDYIRACSR